MVGLESWDFEDARSDNYLSLCFRRILAPDPHLLPRRYATFAELTSDVRHINSQLASLAGGFWSSSPEEHRFITVPFITHSNNGLKLLAVDYRLSPANPYPSPVIDALSVYQHLVLNEGMEPEMIFFGGDSAGGNLVGFSACSNHSY
jgi:hypothetical protein